MWLEFVIGHSQDSPINVRQRERGWRWIWGFEGIWPQRHRDLTLADSFRGDPRNIVVKFGESERIESGRWGGIRSVALPQEASSNVGTKGEIYAGSVHLTEGRHPGEAHRHKLVVWVGSPGSVLCSCTGVSSLPPVGYRRFQVESRSLPFARKDPAVTKRIPGIVEYEDLVELQVEALAAAVPARSAPEHKTWRPVISDHDRVKTLILRGIDIEELHQVYLE